MQDYDFSARKSLNTGAMALLGAMLTNALPVPGQAVDGVTCAIRTDQTGQKVFR